MILKKIYSEPEGLFKTTEFKSGINFIYGEKEINSPKNSLNSIGKSTFLDLIDFCLLSSFQKSHSPRLYSAKNILTGYNIVLEFKVDNVDYTVKRNIDYPSNPEFGKSGEKIELYKIDQLKKLLFEIIFRRDNYLGVQNDKWFRVLLSFYIKVQKFKQAKFLDPIKFIPELSEVELNVYHFFLLGIDNNIPHKLLRYRTDEKGLKTSLDEIEKYVVERYDLKNLKETQNEINKLRVDIEKLNVAIEKFELGEQYEDAEKEANQLTESIKNNLYNNYLDKDKIKSYQESFSLNEKINLRRINLMYNQVSEELAINVKKTLQDAINFRKELSNSRKEFISNEIDKLKENVEKRENTIKSFEAQRAKLFYFLSAKEAISDLTEAFYNVSEKKNKLSELESNTKILFDLTKELSEIEGEINNLKIESFDFLNSIGSEITHFYKNFNKVYDAIYIDNKESSQFTISPNPKKKSLIEIDISMPDMFGKGKNQGRTLIYDLSILISNIMNTKNFPRFLIHDGIFDGVDKAHFISVCKLIDNLAINGGMDLQYITTINEEGTLSADKFGEAELVKESYIEEKSILILSHSNKLFKKDF